MAETCKGTILVQKTIYPGAILCVGQATQIIEREVTGPLQAVCQDEEGMETVVFKSSAETATVKQ